MSHAANLRKYRPQQTQALPQKRRKLSPSAAPEKLTNGVPVTGKTLSAVPTHDLKAEKQRAAQNGSKVTVAHPRDTATNLDHESSESSSSEDDKESSSSDSSDDDSDDAPQPNQKPNAASDDITSESSDAESDEVQDEDENNSTAKPNPAANSTANPSIPAPETEEPSFGDLLASRAPETIVVDQPAADSAHASRALTNASGNKALNIPSANSLGTVLTQALKTNDVDLLESCLHVPNLESIRATIERIHPSHATTLLKRLAERLHKRPGRAGSLMVWIQWTVVAHGGYLASQPAAMKELRTLYQVVKQRASGLQPLLALKGKLDMLEAQMQLRRNMQARSRATDPADTQENILYVEGHEQSESDEEGGPSVSQVDGRHSKAPKSGNRPPPDEISDDMLMSTKLPNGVPESLDEVIEDNNDVDEDDEEEMDSSSEDQEDLIDDEAEEGDSDSSAMSDDIDYDDVDGADDLASGDEDEDEDEDEEQEAFRPSKRSRHHK